MLFMMFAQSTLALEVQNRAFMINCLQYDVQKLEFKKNLLDKKIESESPKKELVISVIGIILGCYLNFNVSYAGKTNCQKFILQFLSSFSLSFGGCGLIKVLDHYRTCNRSLKLEKKISAICERIKELEVSLVS